MPNGVGAAGCGNIWNSPPEQTSEIWLAIKCKERPYLFYTLNFAVFIYLLYKLGMGDCKGGFNKRFRQPAAPTSAGLYCLKTAITL
jgi:hypothetical protein